MTVAKPSRSTYAALHRCRRKMASRRKLAPPDRTRTADAGLRTASLCPLSYGGAISILPRPERGLRRPSPTIHREMHAAPLPDLVLYGRPGCGLCDETRALLTALREERARAGLAVPRLVERDIETDRAWEQAYFASIPVVELGDRRLELATSVAKLRRPAVRRPGRLTPHTMAGTDLTILVAAPRASSASFRRACCHSSRPTSAS